MLDAIAAHAEICELSTSNVPEDEANAEVWVSDLRLQLDEIETSLIPFGMHVIGSPMTSAERAETVAAIAQAGGADEIDQNRLDSVLASGDRGALNGLLAAHRVAADDIESLADRLVEAFSHLVEEFDCRL